jgi:hypothetical protein
VSVCIMCSFANVGSPFFLDCMILKTKELQLAVTSVISYHTTLCNIREDLNLQ